MTGVCPQRNVSIMKKSVSVYNGAISRHQCQKPQRHAFKTKRKVLSAVLTWPPDRHASDLFWLVAKIDLVKMRFTWVIYNRFWLNMTLRSTPPASMKPSAHLCPSISLRSKGARWQVRSRLLQVVCSRHCGIAGIPGRISYIGGNGSVGSSPELPLYQRFCAIIHWPILDGSTGANHVSAVLRITCSPCKKLLNFGSLVGNWR